MPAWILRYCFRGRPMNSRLGRRKNSTTSPTWAWRAAICSPMSIRVLLLGADPALRDLVGEWLAPHGHELVADRPDLVLVGVPYSRVERGAALARAATAYPLARVLPMPLTRDALMAALQ